jgi:hypothetical protein
MDGLQRPGRRIVGEEAAIIEELFHHRPAIAQQSVAQPAVQGLDDRFYAFG